MSLRLLILLLLVTPSFAADPSPKPYHRFYQGYRLDTVSKEKFTDLLNDQFFPLFSLAHPLGLAAYRPALPLDPGVCAVPAEVALLTFESEAIYNRYRESEVGKKIREAHNLVFKPDTSKSLVPEPYQGKVQLERAYDRTPAFKDYAGAESVLYIHCRPTLTGPKFIQALTQAQKTPTQAHNILFAVSPNHVIEYVFYDSKAVSGDALFEEAKARYRGIFTEALRVFLPKKKIGASRTKINQGFDAQW